MSALLVWCGAGERSIFPRNGFGAGNGENDSENGLQGGKDTNGAEGQESRDRMAEEQDAGRQTEWGP